MAEISANAVLPARREALHLRTDDGLTLVGELALPAENQPSATIVTVHPLPTHGGSSDSHLLRKMAWRLPALADIAVLRFNTRGTSSSLGVSDGEFDEGRGEGYDLRAAVAEVVRRGLPDPWLVGWSFGTDVILRHGDIDPVKGVVLLSPPLRTTTPQELAAWGPGGRPVICLVPELDDYLQPDAARERFGPLPQARVEAVEGARHLWVGERYVRIALDEIVASVRPERSPLPTTWDGPMERWNDL